MLALSFPASLREAENRSAFGRPRYGGATAPQGGLNFIILRMKNPRGAEPPFPLLLLQVVRDSFGEKEEWTFKLW